VQARERNASQLSAELSESRAELAVAQREADRFAADSDLARARLTEAEQATDATKHAMALREQAVVGERREMEAQLAQARALGSRLRALVADFGASAVRQVRRRRVRLLLVCIFVYLVLHSYDDSTVVSAYFCWG
jgi:hypothetical protein